MTKAPAPACDTTAAQITTSSGLDEAAAGLGTEIVRFSRLISAWKQRVRTDGGAADRVLLARLVVGGDRRATDLAADAFLDLSTVSRQVRSLVERGLVARRPDPEDRRGTLLAATEAGRAAFSRRCRCGRSPDCGHVRRRRPRRTARPAPPAPRSPRR